MAKIVKSDNDKILETREVKIKKEKVKKEKPVKEKPVKEKKENKKSKVKVIVTLIVILVLIAGATCSIIFIPSVNDFVTGLFKKDKKGEVVEVKVLDSLDDYGYSLSDKDTLYFKKEYNVLKDILNKDDFTDEEYATQVAKVFVIDLYTIDTKVNKLDIGGSEYYYLDKVSMYEKKVMDTLYSHLLDNTYGDRKQELPVVKEAKVLSTEAMKYKMGDKEKDAFLVKLEWSFEENMGYDTKGSVVLVEEEPKEDSKATRISVVDFQPTLTPNYNPKK